MRYLKPLRPFLAWSQLSIPTVYDDSLSYYEVLNKCIFHFNEMLKIMQENYKIIDEAFAKILEECEAAIARCEEAAARAEAAQSAAEKAQAAAEAAQAAAEAAQKLAEAAQAAAEAARDDAVTAQKASEAAQAAAEAAQAAAEAAQKKAETAQTAAEAAQAKAEDAQEKAESARDAAEAAQTAAEAAQQKAEEAQSAAESARDAAEAAQRGAEAAQAAAEASEQAAADSAADAAASAEEIKNALDNYYDKTESDAAFVKKAGDTMTGNLTMLNNSYLAGNATYLKLQTFASGEVDLDKIYTNRLYASADANTFLNTPPGETSKYFILNVTMSQVVTNLYFGYQTIIYLRNNHIYHRVVNTDGTWGDWVKLTYSSDLEDYLPLSGGTMTGKINVEDELNDTFTGLSKGNYVTSINENSDLNNVRSNCINYYPTKVATSDESKNFPAKIPGLLVTLVRYPSIFIRQIYYSTPSNAIYTRIYRSDTNSWSDWGKIPFEGDIAGNYLPLSGGTMTGNITMSNDTKLIGNAETSDFFKLIHIPNASDMNKIIESGFYAITSGDSVSNAPEEISAENNAFSCFVFPWQYPGTTSISQLLFSGDGTTVKGVYLRLTNNPEVGWGNWVRLDNTATENTVKIYQIQETEHLRFIVYDLGNYYKVEGYTKIQLAWRIPKTIESNPVVGTVYKYSTFTDFDEIKGTDPYTMSSDNHINVCPGLDYFRPNGFTSGTSAGNMLSNIVFNDTAGNFYFEIQITWPDNEVWDYIGNHYNVLINENSLIGTLIVSK